MNKIILIILCLFIFIIGMSFVSAKEDTHFEIEKDSSGYSSIVTLKDSNNNPVPKVKFSIKITKPNGNTRTLSNKKLNSTGQNIFFLGSTKGDYVISVEFKGNSNYNPSKLTKTITVTAGKGGNSALDYFENGNYGLNQKKDDYIDDNYWYEEIYDNPFNFDGEGY
ncbi:MAG: hypothetical protein E7Z73_00480 [Methanobrevibacter millerae]|uniref:Adhesin-like protein n=1 Tax=Methanobrevibacter millerae TaxID=230361 RepID=A0A8T3VD48_9EURY|nr:hypothetical protein [Methanobrevibacter millerae]MBE6504206.1 hypothetical protein [Methanobrevibacter millerae]